MIHQYKTYFLEPTFYARNKTFELLKLGKIAFQPKLFSQINLIDHNYWKRIKQKP